MIKLIQHVNNSSLYIDACAHGNSVYPVVIQPQSLQQQSMRVYIYKSVILYVDGLIRRYRVLALTVWGPLLPSPIFRTRGGGVMIQTVEAVNSMSLSKGNCIWWAVEANCAKPPVRAIRVQTFITIPRSFLPSLYISKANPSKVAEFLTPFGTF